MQYILELEMPNFPYIANTLTYFPTHTQKKIETKIQDNVRPTNSCT